MKIKIKTSKQIEEEYKHDLDYQWLLLLLVERMEVEMPKDRIVDIDEFRQWDGWYVSEDISETQETEDEDED